jgi:WD40 repeat protein/serine/threonine protein kinase
MTDRAICPKCHREVPPEARNRLCPACLLEMARTPLQPPVVGEVSGEPEPGLGLGDYELLEEIARGGMGIVFKARQKSLDRIVAVKMILAGEWASPEFTARFLREAQAAARLHHPHIVAIHEVGEHEGRQFFSMEHVEGINLNQFAAQTPFAELIEHVVPMMAKIARAVHYAHERGVLHRDLKPSNILLDREGEPHLTDFGLAKIVEENGDAATAGWVRAADLTVTGQTLGSPNYLPPEQLHSRPGRVGPAGDIYALGAVLYYLLTGRPPFVGKTIHATLAQVERQEPVPPRLLNPSVSRDLETICLKCLEKDPARRYPSALALAEDLEDEARGKPIQARPISRLERGYRTARRHPALSLLTMALIVSLVSGLTGVTWLWQRAQANARRETRERQRAERLLDRLDFDRAETFFAGNQPDRGLASLARAVRRHPHDQALAARLVSALTLESFPLPLGPYLECGSAVRDALFSPGQRWIATVTDHDGAQLWDADTLEATGPPIRPEGPIDSAVFHPSLPLLATGSGDGTARLWRVPEGTPATPLLRHDGPVTRVAFNEDGSILASASRDGTVRLWRTADGSAAAAPLVQASPVLDVQFQPGSGDIATGAEDGTVRVWRFEKGNYVDTRIPHPRKVTRVLFRPNHPQLLTVCHDGHLRLWNVADGRLVFDVVAHSPATSMTAVHFDAEGRQIVTCSWDNTAKVFDGGTGSLLVGPLEHGAAPVDAAWFGEGEFLVTGSRDTLVRLWDARTGHLLGAPVRHGFMVSSVAISPGGSRLLTASKDHAARLLDLRPGQDWPRQMTLPDAVTDVLSLPGERILAATRDGIAAWNPGTGTESNVTYRSGAPLIKIACDPTGSRIAGVDLNGTVEVWNQSNPGKPIRTFHHGQPVNAMEFSSDGTRLLTSGGTLRLWTLADGKEVVMPLPPHRIALAHFRPDGRRLVVASWDGTAQIWDARTAQPVTPLMRHEDSVLDAAYDPSGRWIATASRDRTARIWDAETGQPAGPPMSHRHEVRRVAFGPRGRTLATVSLDYHVSLWRVPEGTPAVAGPLRHPARVTSLAFGPRGDWLATGTETGEVRVWSVTEGLPVTPPIHHDGQISELQFMIQGRALLTASWDGTVRVYDLPTFAGPAPAWLPDLAEAVGGLRLTGTGVEEVVPARSFLELKRTSMAGSQAGEFQEWVRWFLADRGTRTISFRSSTTVPDYVRRCLQVNSDKTLRAALRLSPTNPKVIARWRQGLDRKR